MVVVLLIRKSVLSKFPPAKIRFFFDIRKNKVHLLTHEEAFVNVVKKYDADFQGDR